MTSWQDIQQKTFTRWCNVSLQSRGMHIDDLIKDVKVRGYHYKSLASFSVYCFVVKH
jgi:hypothetical protein